MKGRIIIIKAMIAVVAMTVISPVSAMTNVENIADTIIVQSVNVDSQAEDLNNPPELTQAAFSARNKVYVIKNDFVLIEDIIIPPNSLLEFDGGSLNGAHTITGNNTRIQAGLDKIFSTDVIFAGKWKVPEAYPEWFGAKGDGETDDLLAIESAIRLSNIRLQGKTYYISETLNINSNRSVVGEKGATVIKISDHGKKHSIVILSEASGVTIKDIVFTVDNFEWAARYNNDHKSEEYRRYNKLREQEIRGGIRLEKGCSNVTIDGIEVYNSGYGILAYMSNKNVIIRNCYIHHTMVDGIAMYVGNSLFVVENNRLEYTCDDAISVVSTHDGGIKEECSDIIVRGNYISNCYSRPFIVNGSKNITFENNTVIKNGLQLFYISNYTGNSSVDPLSRPNNIKVLNNSFCYSYLNVPPSIDNRLFIANAVDTFIFEGNVITYCDEYDASKGNYIQIYNATKVKYKNNVTEHAGVKIINAREILFKNNTARVNAENAVTIESSVSFNISNNSIQGTNAAPSKINVFSSSSKGKVKNNKTDNCINAIGKGAKGIKAKNNVSIER